MSVDLPGAVLADQAQDLAGLQVEVRAVQHDVADEALRHPAHAQHRPSDHERTLAQTDGLCRVARQKSSSRRAEDPVVQSAR